MKYMLFAGTFAAASIAAAPLAATNVEIEAEGPVIELTVIESVSAEPDLVTIGAGVSTDARSAVDAMRMNATEMRKVIDRIKSLGVDEKDIQTTGINLSAQYDYNRQTQQQDFRGYRVSNRVSVKLRDIDATGTVLDALVVAGATDLSGPNFSIEDDTAAKAEARQRAVERAKAQALEYAALHGYDDVALLSISESIQGRGQMPQMRAMAFAEETADASAPVQPGQVSTGVSITINYEMIEDEEAEAAAEE